MLRNTPWKFIKPRWLLAGMVIGFATCSLLGLWVSHRNFYKNFVRFNGYLNAIGHYYPTIAQMRQIALDGCPPDKILVIVGGNSIFNGFGGQSDENLWTHSLQKKLGDNYRVFNFALPASPCPTPVIFAAMSLEAIHPRIIYVCNTGAQSLVETNADPSYRYTYWEAYFNHFVHMSAAQMAGEYETPHLPLQLPYKITLRDILEARESARLDHWFHFRDFWDFVTYRYFSTVWVYYDQNRWLKFLKPRKGLVENADPLPSLEMREQRWAASEEATGLIRQNKDAKTNAVVDDPSTDPVKIDTPSWRHFDQVLELYVPPSFGSKTLMVFTPRNPWLVDTYSTAEAARNTRISTRITNRLFLARGLSTILENEVFQPGDYIDSVHLTSSGGEKLATMIAPKIEEMSLKLGYLKTAE